MNRRRCLLGLVISAVPTGKTDQDGRLNSSRLLAARGFFLPGLTSLQSKYFSFDVNQKRLPVIRRKQFAFFFFLVFALINLIGIVREISIVFHYGWGVRIGWSKIELMNRRI